MFVVVLEKSFCKTDPLMSEMKNNNLKMSCNVADDLCACEATSFDGIPHVVIFHSAEAVPA